MGRFSDFRKEEATQKIQVDPAIIRDAIAVWFGHDLKLFDIPTKVEKSADQRAKDEGLYDIPQELKNLLEEYKRNYGRISVFGISQKVDQVVQTLYGFYQAMQAELDRIAKEDITSAVVKNSVRDINLIRAWQSDFDFRSINEQLDKTRKLIAQNLCGSSAKEIEQANAALNFIFEFLKNIDDLAWALILDHVRPEYLQDEILRRLDIQISEYADQAEKDLGKYIEAIVKIEKFDSQDQTGVGAFIELYNLARQVSWRDLPGGVSAPAISRIEPVKPQQPRVEVQILVSRLGESARDRVEHILGLLAIHEGNMEHLENQKSQFGELDVPIHILNQIKNEQRQINEKKQTIAFILNVDVSRLGGDEIALLRKTLEL